MNVYEIITNKIMELLEQGTVPWHKPWSSPEPPKNLISKRYYRGINPFLLNSLGFESPYWLSFRQVKEIGGSVMKGEKSCPVVFFKVYDKENDQTDDDGERAVIDRRYVLRYYNVFNSQQCTGIEKRIPAQPVDTFQFDPIEKAEQIVQNMPNPPAIQQGGGRAWYAPSLDLVKIPKPERFEKPEAYYSTLFHELSHSTGHASRLNRAGATEVSSFGSSLYSKEELVAEMSSAFLCGFAGIEQTTIDNSAAYVDSWLSRLKEDNRLVVIAAAQAQKSADFILNIIEGSDSE